MTHTVFLDQPPLFWSVIDMLIRVGLLAVTRLVLDFPVARNGSIALACWGIVPAAVTAIVGIMRVVSTFFNVVIRLACVFWIMRALIVRMLGFCSMHVTGFQILVISRRRCLAFIARILFGTTIAVPFTIVRVQRNSS